MNEKYPTYTPYMIQGSEMEPEEGRVIIDYELSTDCTNEDVWYICYKCGKCGRRFDRGFLVNAKEEDE